MVMQVSTALNVATSGFTYTSRTGNSERVVEDFPAAVQLYEEERRRSKGTSTHLFSLSPHLFVLLLPVFPSSLHHAHRPPPWRGLPVPKISALLQRFKIWSKQDSWYVSRYPPVVHNRYLKWPPSSCPPSFHSILSGSIFRLQTLHLWVPLFMNC